MEDNSTYLTDEWSAKFRDASRFWIQRILVPLIVGVGVLGNVVTIVILTRRRMRSSTNVYLTALAVSDLLYLMFVFTLSLQHYPNIHEPSSFMWYWEYFVCHPMRGRLICTESRAKKVILLVYIFCFVTTVTTSFEYEADVKRDANGTEIYASFIFTTLANNETYKNIFYWFTTITFVFVPLILLGIFNSFLIHAVEQCDSVQTQENKITITLIAVVILFMVCQIPAAITLIYNLFHKPAEGSVEINVLMGLGNIFNFLVTINAACNFVLYCAFSDKYRRTFLLTFLPSFCYHPPRPSRHNTAFSSVYDGPSTLRRSVRATSVRVSASSYDNGKMFKSSGDKSNDSQEQQSFPMIQQPTENNFPSPIESLKIQLLSHGLPFQNSKNLQSSSFKINIDTSAFRSTLQVSLVIDSTDSAVHEDRECYSKYCF
ncbi:hypothetical protein C0J52_02671 [Blattella germanica]|nr:hypothetical protein C0J52_02671 [Blattella germanica]